MSKVKKMQPSKLAENLADLERRLVVACRRANRPRSEVTLIAVTKTVSAETAAQLPTLGVRHLGENRPQELARKAAALSPDIHWHLIGHLQRNKIADVLPLVTCIHSLDSLQLLNAIDKEADKQGRAVSVLLEVNASGEHSKQGFAPDELPALLPHIRSLRNAHIQGLMTMAALQEPEQCRPTFTLLRQWRDRLRAELAPPHTMEHLSMGMSNDFEVAVEEGATFVRLGTVLFQEILES